jgi:hypothetical protein
MLTSQGNTKLKGGLHAINLEQTNMCLVPYSTLKNYLPMVKPYMPILQQVLQHLPMIRDSYNRGGGWTVNGFVVAQLSLDEVSLRAGLSKLQKFYAVGLKDGPVTPRNIVQLNEDHPDLDPLLATHVLSCWLTSVDGKASVPLFLAPTAGADGLEILNYIDSILPTLVEHKFTVKLVFTDSGIKKLTEMEQGFKRFGIDAVSDPVHDSKNLVNDIRTAPILLNNHSVSIQRTIWPVIKESASLRSQISDKTLFPSDHMWIEPLKALFAILPSLKAVVDGPPGLVEIVEFLDNTKIWYEVLNDHQDYLHLRPEARFQILEPIAEYFLSLQKIRPIVAFRRARQFLNAIQQLWDATPWPPNDDGIWHFGHFGTNLNENFFSILRSKMRYLTLLGVFIIADRAYVELIKRNCSDLGYSYFEDTQMSQCYNNQVFLALFVKQR